MVKLGGTSEIEIDELLRKNTENIEEENVKEEKKEVKKEEKKDRHHSVHIL
jgi:hypothetical protein